MAEEKDKPVFDEQTLAKVLEAAYVLQEHNRELQKTALGVARKGDQSEGEERSTLPRPSSAPRAKEVDPAPADDFTSTLARIVETQHQIQANHLGLEKAMGLVAERLTEIARASGSAVGILEGEKIRYRAAAGFMTLPVGTEVPVEKALCATCLRSGEIIRCADVYPEFLLDTDECRRRGIQSLIAVPVYHDRRIAGGLELYYPTTQAFAELEVHTCQLMAGLITEALERGEQLDRNKSLTTERKVLEALEKLKPNLARADVPAAKEPAARTTAPATAVSASTFVCRKCGHQLVGEEQFCGNCGSPRSQDYEPPSLQSKVAALWHMQEAMRKNPPANGELAHQGSKADLGQVHPEKPPADSVDEQVLKLFSAPELPTDERTEPTELPDALVSAEIEDSTEKDVSISPNAIQQDDDRQVEVTALTKSEPLADWSSAANARDFLEQLATAKRPGALARFWNARRGDIYLAVAVILVAFAIRLEVWSNYSVRATGNPATAAAGHRRLAPEADLSFFDRMLISLGLAEAPDAPEYKGNPDAQVWVDLHTGLYYCTGADLYGKTPKGKFTSQRDAQLDQFEPAYRKACD